ncbi:MAG: hypothetical protein NXI31_19875 [bacterium]|nr:hypothetical protein [bacterium]
MKSRFLATALFALGLSATATAQNITIAAPWIGGPTIFSVPQNNTANNALIDNGVIYASIRVGASCDANQALASGLLDYNQGPVQTFEASTSATGGSSGQWTYVGSQYGIIYDNVYAGSLLTVPQIIDPIDLFASASATASTSCSGGKSANAVYAHRANMGGFGNGTGASQSFGLCCENSFSFYTATNSVILLRGYAPDGFCFQAVRANAYAAATLVEGDC